MGLPATIKVNEGDANQIADATISEADREIGDVADRYAISQELTKTNQSLADADFRNTLVASLDDTFRRHYQAGMIDLESAARRQQGMFQLIGAVGNVAMGTQMFLDNRAFKSELDGLLNPQSQTLTDNEAYLRWGRGEQTTLRQGENWYP